MKGARLTPSPIRSMVLRPLIPEPAQACDPHREMADLFGARMAIGASYGTTSGRERYRKRMVAASLADMTPLP